MAENPYMALVKAESSNPYIDIVKGEGEDYKSASGLLKGVGQVAGSLITPLVAWPVSKAAGAINAAHAYFAGDKETGKAFDTAYEEAMKTMTGLYEPNPGSPAARTIEPISKVFEGLSTLGRQSLDLVSESWGVDPRSALRRIIQTGGELGAFDLGGKVAGGAAKATKGLVADAVKTIKPEKRMLPEAIEKPVNLADIEEVAPPEAKPIERPEKIAPETVSAESNPYMEIVKKEALTEEGVVAPGKTPSKKPWEMTREEGTVVRTVSRRELDNIIKTGEIKSESSLALPVEKQLGLTPFADDVAGTRMYAGQEGEAFIIEVKKTPEMRYDYTQLPDVLSKRNDLAVELKQVEETLAKNGPDWESSKMFQEWAVNNRAELESLNKLLAEAGIPEEQLAGAKAVRLPYPMTNKAVPAGNITRIMKVEKDGVLADVTKDFLRSSESGEGLGKSKSPEVEAKSAETLPEGPELKPHRTALRIEAESIAAEQLSEEGFGKNIAQYEAEKGMIADQNERGLAIIEKDWDLAVKMALNEAPAPEGIRPGTMITLVTKRATEKGDSKTIWKLGTSETAHRPAQEIAKNLKSFDQKLSIDPVQDIRDVNAARQERAKKTGKRGEEIGKQAAEIERLNQELMTTQKTLADYEAKKVGAEKQAAVDELLKPEKPQPKKPSEPKTAYGSKNKIVTQTEYERVKAGLRQKLGTQLTAGLDPTIAADMTRIGAYHFEAGARVFGEWSAKLIEDFGDFVKPHLKDLWEKSKAIVDSKDVEFLTDKIAKSVADGKDFSDIGRQVQALAKQFVEMGIKDREKLVDAVHDVLKKSMPDITRRETMDALSGYGKYKLLSKEEIDVTLRDLKGQMQQAAKLEDLQAKGTAEKTGVERRAPSDEERRLIKLVNDAKKKFGIQTVDKETQLKSSLDAIKTRLTNDIADLESQIASRQKIVKEKTGITYDAEANKLKARRDELKKEFDGIFGKPGLTDAQRAARTVTNRLLAIEKSITKKIEKISTGDIAPEKRTSTTPLTEDLRLMQEVRGILNSRLQEMRKEARPKVDKELRKAAANLMAAEKSITELIRQISTGDIMPKNREVKPVSEDLRLMREARDILKEQRQQMRDLLNPKKTAEQIATQSLKTRLRNEEKKLVEKLAARDFAPQAQRPVILDSEAQTLKAKRDQAKENYNAAAQASRTITPDEAQTLVDLSKVALDAKAVMEQGGDRFAYGAARVAYENYVNGLKGANDPIKTLLKGRGQEFKTTWGESKSGAVVDLAQDTLRTIADNSVAMVATLDNSFLGRQGLHTLMTHPTRWLPAAKMSFIDFYRTLGGKNAHDALMADIYSRPNFINGEYQRAGIIAKTEEQFPSSLPERIPGAGRVFRASEYAFTGSGLRMRTGLYDLLAERAKANGVDMGKKAEIESLGRMINSLTARGKTGQHGEGGVVKMVLWAPKMLKGNWDVLTAHSLSFKDNRLTSFAQKEAGKNLLKIVVETATLMAIANALKPGSAETEPISPDFGKIKAADTRFDYEGGAASLVTLAARIATGESKSSTTGKVTKYQSGFGKRTRFDALIDFLANKTNPPASIVRDWLRGRNFKGEKFTWGNAAYQAFTPILIQQAIDLKDNASADRVAGMIAGAVGVSAMSYDKKKAGK